MPSKIIQNASLKKPIVFLTNFWDANVLLEQRFVFLKFANGEYCKINFLMDSKKKPSNFKVYSIALQSPPFEKLPYIEAAFKGRIDVFCPTWDLLHRYHGNKDWKAYCKDYIAILKNRKDAIKKWMSNLDPSTIYFLCCWENTSGKSHCHREILHSAFKNSKNAQEALVPIFRSGAPIFSKSERDKFGSSFAPLRRQRFEGQSTIQSPWRINTEGAQGTMVFSDEIYFIGIDVTTGERLVVDDMGFLQPIPDTQVDSLVSINDQPIQDGIITFERTI